MKCTRFTLSLIFASVMTSIPSQAWAEDEDESAIHAVSSGSWFDDVGLSGLFNTISPLSVTNLPSVSDEIAATGYTNACKQKVLEKLGWVISTNPVATRAMIGGGNPCDNTDVAESIAQGELRLALPGQGLSDTKLSAIFDDALSSKATVCLFKMQASNGVVSATAKLSQNKNYEFRTGSPFVYLSSTEWERPCRNSLGSRQCYQAANSGSAALDVFVNEKAGTDCQAGLQVAELSTLKETLGSSEFDRLVAPWEVALGPWDVVNKSNNIIWAGARSLETIFDRDAEELSKEGIHSLQAVSGYIGNAWGEDYLDHPVDRGENFITVSVAHSTALRLQAVGGFAFFNKQNEEIQRIARGVSDKSLLKWAADDYDLSTIDMSDRDRATLRELQVLLKDPFYRGYRVFVHPLKVMTMGEHIVRLLERNPRTPYTFRLYPTRYNGGLSSLYVKSMLDRCDSL